MAGLVLSPTSCPSVKGDKCIFPFKKGSTTYNVCQPYRNKYYCATSLKSDGSYNTWDYCDTNTCPNPGTCSPGGDGGCNYPFRQGGSFSVCAKTSSHLFWCTAGDNSGSGSQCPKPTPPKPCPKPEVCPVTPKPTVWIPEATIAPVQRLDPRLIIVGGEPSSVVGSSVESYPPSSSLSIPPLPESRSYHSLTLLPGPPPTLVVCGGLTTSQSCISWRTGLAGWQDYQTLKQKRYRHTAARTGLSILVMGGGSSSRKTAELVPGGGEFDLQHDSYSACAIALEDTGEVVLIGGGYPSIHGHVSRYSSTGFLGSLPDLGQKRSSHACGSFTTSRGEKMLLVTGGHDRSRLSSTELLSLSSPTSWTTAASLPQAMNAPSVASLPGPAGVDIYCAGGWDGFSSRDEVLKYDVEDDIWKQVGKMAKARAAFGMVGVP